jgi:Asp-tRNA(Asn)/Glu-tRNA(Gln) amidotransferase A subunit family amidase
VADTRVLDVIAGYDPTIAAPAWATPRTPYQSANARSLAGLRIGVVRDIRMRCYAGGHESVDLRTRDRRAGDAAG